MDAACNDGTEEDAGKDGNPVEFGNFSILRDVTFAEFGIADDADKEADVSTTGDNVVADVPFSRLSPADIEDKDDAGKGGDPVELNLENF